MHSHLPPLVKSASNTLPPHRAIRLVTLPKGSEARLSAALCIPRVGLIGLKGDSPEISSLIQFIREDAQDMEIPWMGQTQKGEYIPVDVKIDSVIVPAKPKLKPRQADQGASKP